MRTVLVFAYECAPYHRAESTIGAQRPAMFAKHLPSHGWRAIVICCDARRRGRHRRGELLAVEAEVRDLLRASDDSSSVIIPVPSLEWDGLVDRAWRSLERETSVLGTSMRRLLTLARIFTGDYSRAWQPCASTAARVVLESTRVDAILGAHSPDAGLHLARRLAERTKLPWIADFRDPVTLGFGPAGRRLYAPIARGIVSSAFCTVNVNPVWTDLDRRLLRRPSRCIPNGYDPEDFEHGETPVSHGSDPFTVAYMGTILDFQTPEPLLAALRILRDKPLPRPVRLLYRGPKKDLVLAMARKHGVLDRLDAGDRVERDVALAMLRRADLLLVLSVAPTKLRDELFSSGFYPGKVFECFGARRPILCTPGDGGILDDLVRRTATGVVLGDPVLIAEYLERCATLSEPPTFQPNEELVRTYARKNLAGELAALLDEATLDPQDLGRHVGTRPMHRLSAEVASA